MTVGILEGLSSALGDELTELAGLRATRLLQDFKTKCIELFSDAERSNAFFFKALRGGFKFETLGIRKKNISDFLDPEVQLSFRVFAMQAGDLQWLLVE